MRATFSACLIFLEPVGRTNFMFLILIRT
jgi:hypothetical protein